MNTKNISDEFVCTMKVVQRSAHRSRAVRRSSRIIPAAQVQVETQPIVVGETKEKIQIVPIMENGRIKALKAFCSCGSESIYDIQYTEPEVDS